MTKRLITLRVDTDLLDWVDGYAVSIQVDRTTVITDLLRALRADRLRFDPPAEPEAFPASSRHRGLDLGWANDTERREMVAKFDLWWACEPATGCWSWLAERPVFYWEGRSYPAARFSYALHKGPIRDGLTVRHTCNNTNCVFPNHLKATTPLDIGGNAQPSRPEPRPNPQIETLFTGSWESADAAFPASAKKEPKE